MSASITPVNGLARVPMYLVQPSPNNPRKTLTEIDELAASIKEAGMIQPIVVQRIPNRNHLQIVAGHRRHAAAKRLGWHELTVLIRRDMLPDEELVTMLIENGQRANLDPLEEARALAWMHTSMGFSYSDIAKKIGRSLPYVQARRHLLNLGVEDQEQVRAGNLGIVAGVEKAKVESGATRQRSAASDRGWHFSHTNELATKAAARCTRLKHQRGRRVSGGVACGECWESVIRSDERTSLVEHAQRTGSCATCGSQDTKPAGVEAVGT